MADKRKLAPVKQTLSAMLLFVVACGSRETKNSYEEREQQELTAYVGSPEYPPRIETALAQAGCIKEVDEWTRYFEVDKQEKKVFYYFTRGELADDKAGRYSGPLPLNLDDRRGEMAYGSLDLQTGKVSVEVCGRNVL